ncbi:MAG: hypothetical protein HGA44_12345, partial [Cellulomonadaceae bacterium]|nr:hypothetical protein [Cellulomonadaceae bacterium]
MDVAKATDSSDASRGAANLLAPKPTTNALGGGLITEKAKENWLQDIADRADTIGGPSLGEKYLMPGLAWVGDQFTKVGTYYEAVDRYTARSQDEGSALGEYAGATLFRLPGAAWLDPDFHEEWDAAKESAASTGQTAWLSVTRGDTEYQDTYAILDDPMNQIPTVNEDGTTGPSARDEYFSPWYRKFATGTFDFAFTFYADPTILGGKALGAARATRNTINISDASAAYARTTAMHAGADEAAQAIAATTAREGISDLAPLRFRADGSTTGELRVAATVSRAVEASEVARKAALAGKAGGYAALARTSLLSQAADGGGIAYLMQRTDAITDDAVRLAVKRDVFYAGMGVKPAIKSLKQKSDMIALELEAMNGPNRAAIIGGLMVRNDIPYADILRKIDADSWTDEVMAAHADEIAKFRQGLENYDSGLQRAIATGTRGLPVDAKGFSGVGELAKMDDFAGKYDFMRVAKTIQRGAALPPIHVLVGTHIPGVIRISDDVAPDIFEQSVSRTAKALGDKKLNAQMMVLAERFRLAQGEAFPGASRMARRDIVIEFEKLVEKALVTKHTAHLKDAEAIATRSAQIRSAITEIKRRRLDETTHLDERMQSLIPGKGAKGYTQDEFGVYSLPSVKRAADDATPFAATQGQDTIALVDYKKLSKMLDENLDPLDGYMRLRAGSRDAWEFTTAGISAFVDLWKFGALFRAGYFVRNQIDNQARLLATIGSLEMFHNTFAGLKNQRFNRGWISEAEAIAGREHLNAQAWIRTIDDDLTFASDDAAFARLWGERAEADKALKAAQARLTQARNSRLVKRGKGKNAVRRGQTVQARHLGLRDGDYTAAYSSIDDYARTHQQISAHRSIVGLMTGGEASELARYRAQRIRASLPTAESGRVRAIGYKHPRWADEYATFVNHRVRNDHALMMVLNGESDDAIRAYYTGTHEGRAQWADLSKRWPESARRDGLDNLIRHQREQMDLAFPTESMKTRARAGDIDANWARESFPVREQRPGVPADLYEGINSAKVSEFYTRPRDWFFKYAAEIPETMLGRHPFYVSRFNMHMQQIIAGAGGRKSFESLTLREINAARSRASVLARREIGNYLFDTARRSNLSHYLRFIAPFYSAWSDTMRKWARIGGENPWVFPVMGKVFMAPNASLLVTDEDGNRIDSAGNVLGADGEVIRKSADFTEGIIHLPTPDWLSTRLVG